MQLVCNKRSTSHHKIKVIISIIIFDKVDIKSNGEHQIEKIIIIILHLRQTVCDKGSTSWVY